MQVHLEHGCTAIGIRDKFLREHDDYDSLLAAYLPGIITAADEVLSGKAARLGVERL
jgi:hypothetical protein